MSFRFPIALFTAICLLVPTAHANDAPAPVDPVKAVKDCKANFPDHPFNYHRCLIGEYEKMEKESDRIVDMLLGRIGEHRSFGRLRIMQWSDSVIKAQRNWKKFIIWDCEWGGHLKEDKVGAAAAMTECRIHQAASRIDELLGRMAEYDKMIDGK